MPKMTVGCRVEDIGDDVTLQLQDTDDKSIALDDGTDVVVTTQVRIFIREVTDFQIHEGLLSLESLKDQTRGVDVFNAVCRAFGNYVGIFHWCHYR